MTVKELLIKIFTRSDTKGAERAEKSLDRTSKKSRTLKDRLDDMSRSGGAFGRVAGGAFRMLTSPLGMVTAGFAALALAIRGAIKVLKTFAGQELSEVDLDAALAQMGQLTDSYRLKLHDLANQYQDLTTVGDQTWLAAEAQLTRFGMNAGNVDQVMESVKNLAGLLQTGSLEGRVQTATMLIQRALEGNTEMFTRYGITVQKTGDVMRDFNNLTQLLAEKGAGALEARAKTLSGQMKNLTNSMGDFVEAAGGALGRNRHLRQSIQFLTDGYKTMIKTVNKSAGAMKEFRDKAERDMQAPLKEIGDFTEDVTKKLDQFAGVDFSRPAAALEQFAKNMKTAAAESEKALKNIEALESAELGVKIAEIELAEAEGALTPQEADRQKLAARRAASEERYQRSIDSLRKSIDERRDTLAGVHQQHSEGVRQDAIMRDKLNDLREEIFWAEKNRAPNLQALQKDEQELVTSILQNTTRVNKLAESYDSLSQTVDDQNFVDMARLKTAELNRQKDQLLADAKTRNIAAEEEETKAKTKRQKLEDELARLKEAQAVLERQKKEDLPKLRSAAFQESREAEQAQAALERGPGASIGRTRRTRDLNRDWKKAVQEADDAARAAESLNAYLAQTLKSIKEKTEQLESQLRNSRS